MSTTQQLMLPNGTANYDAPKGGFSADPKVPLLAKLTSGQPTATSSAGGNNAGQVCFEGSMQPHRHQSLQWCFSGAQGL